MSDHGSRPPRPGSTLLFRIMNPELFYTVPKPVLAVGAAVVRDDANTSRFTLSSVVRADATSRPRPARHSRRVIKTLTLGFSSHFRRSVNTSTSR